MSWPHTDLPSPGRVSLGRVVAARIGHARRRGRAFVPQGCTQQGRLDESIPSQAASACSEYLEDEGEPLTWRESLRFWATTAAPAVVAGLAFVLLVWGFKP